MPSRPDRLCDRSASVSSDEVTARLGTRVGRHQQAGLLELLSDRVGLRAVCPRAGHSGHGPRLGRRLAGFLRAASEPRLPAGIRSAVRAVSGREPPRGARYRHRLLPAAARRGDPVRQGQVRRGERGADRHVRHAGGPGGDPRRGPGAGSAHPAGRRRSWPWCPRNWASRWKRPSKRATNSRRPTTPTPRSASCWTWRRASRGWPATSAPTPPPW